MFFSFIKVINSCIVAVLKLIKYFIDQTQRMVSYEIIKNLTSKKLWIIHSGFIKEKFEDWFIYFL